MICAQPNTFGLLVSTQDDRLTNYAITLSAKTRCLYSIPRTPISYAPVQSAVL
jgi:hypothetical protein